MAKMETKLKDNEFITDMYVIIRPGISYRRRSLFCLIDKTKTVYFRLVDRTRIPITSPNILFYF